MGGSWDVRPWPRDGRQTTIGGMRDALAEPAHPVWLSTSSAAARRSPLRCVELAAGTVLVAGAAGLTYRALEQGVSRAGTGPAFDAWRTWEEGDGPESLVNAAVLAASPHNSQAWLFAVTPARIDLYADRRRTTGALDPFDREMYVGLGCALENLVQASLAKGYRAAVTLMPTPGRAVHAATVSLAAGPRHKGELYDAIPHRHTDRTAYKRQAVPEADLATMSGLARDLPAARLEWFTSDPDRKHIGRLMIDAAEAVTHDEQQSRDGFRLFQSSWGAIQRHKDGLTLDTQGMAALTTAVAKILPAPSRARGDKFWVDSTRNTHTATAAAYGFITVGDASDPAQRLEGGRLLQRVHLWAAASGIALQHMNQITERADRERESKIEPTFGRALSTLIGDGQREALVAFRIGYPCTGNGQRKSPRRPATEVIGAPDVG